MANCPLCERSVDTLHPLPPEIMTKDLLAALSVDHPAEGAVCVRCMDRLMEATPLADLQPGPLQ